MVQDSKVTADRYLMGSSPLLSWASGRYLSDLGLQADGIQRIEALDDEMERLKKEIGRY